MLTYPPSKISEIVKSHTKALEKGLKSQMKTKSKKKLKKKKIVKKNKKQKNNANRERLIYF